MSTPPTWLKVAVRTVRRSPRLSAAADSALAHARGNRAMVDIANRVFGLDFTQPIVFLNAGRALAEVSAVERLPIVLVRAVGVSATELPGLLADLEALQRRTQGFRPVLVLETPAFREVREFGYPMELVVPEAEWSFDAQWSDYVANRVATMFFRYRAWLIVDVERGPQGAAVIDLAGRRILEQLEHYLPGRADGASRST